MRKLAPAASNSRVAPGEMANAAPAFAARLRSSGDITVPAPTQISGTALAMASMAASACGVRNVTSMTRMPPRASARARSAALLASSMVTTGMTGESCRISAIGARVFIRSSSHCEAPPCQQLLDLPDTRAIDVAGNGVLEAAGGEREVQRSLIVQSGERAVQNAGRECIAGADSIHDRIERVRPRRREALPCQLQGGELVMIDAVLDAHGGCEALQIRERRECLPSCLLETICRRAFW